MSLRATAHRARARLVRPLQALQQRVQRWQPARQQVAVLQQHPEPARGAGLHRLGRARTHALPQRQVLQPHARAEAQRLACAPRKRLLSNGSSSRALDG